MRLAGALFALGRPVAGFLALDVPEALLAVLRLAEGFLAPAEGFLALVAGFLHEMFLEAVFPLPGRTMVS